MKYLLAFIAAFLVGCAGVRLTDAQAAQLSQAKADTQAARATTDEAARATLFQAVGSRVLAGLAEVDLPAPETPASALVAPDGTPVAGAVAAEFQASQAAEASPPPGRLSLALGAVGGLGLAALSVLRLSPGAFGAVANIAHTLLAPKATREMRKIEKQAVVVAQQAVQYGHTVTEVAKAAGLGPAVLSLQEDAGAVQDELGIREQIKTLLALAKQRATPTMSDHA